MAPGCLTDHAPASTVNIIKGSRQSIVDAQGAANENKLCFERFGRLPAEIQLMIWKVAFDDVDPAVVICTATNGRHSMSVKRRHSRGSRLPPVALACRQSRREWVRCARSYKSPDGLVEHVYVPRTVFLIPAATIVQGRSRGLGLSLTHVAIDITDCPDVLLIFEALARFPQLRTIIIIIPSGAIDETQVGMWQQELREVPRAVRRIGGLVDSPSCDGEWHEGTRVGWLLRNYLDGAQAKAFYRRQDGPVVKLLVDPARRHFTTRAWEKPWSLFLY
ncbi:hypothetical protein FDECE_14343 [Fusarium decemcellulare]|nr:hypothetical protein FDECE_14343 [Fusarium decemcellulare]